MFESLLASDTALFHEDTDNLSYLLLNISSTIKMKHFFMLNETFHYLLQKNPYIHTDTYLQMPSILLCTTLLNSVALQYYKACLQDKTRRMTQSAGNPLFSKQMSDTNADSPLKAVVFPD